MGSNDAAAAPDAGESAIQRALEQVRQNPRDHRAYQHLSEAYAKDLQADDLALAAALQAIALEPKAPEAYVQAAAVYGHWSQPERSKEILLRRARRLIAANSAIRPINPQRSKRITCGESMPVQGKVFL